MFTLENSARHIYVTTLAFRKQAFKQLIINLK